MRFLGTRSLFVQHTAKLTVGTIVAQIIPVLAMLGLSRIYTTDDFGVYHLFFQIVTAAAPVMALRMEQPMLTVSRDSEAEALYVLGLKFSIILGLLLSCLVGLGWFFKVPVIKHSLGSASWLIPPAAFLAAQIVVLQYWANRNSDYSVISISKVYLALITNLLPLLMVVWFPANHWGLVASWFLGLLFTNIWLLKKQRCWPLKVWGQKRILMLTFRKWSHFATMNTPALLADQLAATIPIVVISIVYGKSVAGSFGFAQRLIVVPMIFLGASISQVFFKHASDQVNQGKVVLPLLRKLGLVLLAISLVCFISAFILAPYIIPWLFGSQWNEAGIMMSWLSLAMIIKFPVSALSNIFVVTNQIKLQAVWQWLTLIINLLGAMYCFWTNSVTEYIHWLVIQDFILYIIYGVFLFKAAGIRHGSVL